MEKKITEVRIYFRKTNSDQAITAEPLINPGQMAAVAGSSVASSNNEYIPPTVEYLEDDRPIHPGSGPHMVFTKDFLDEQAGKGKGFNIRPDFKRTTYPSGRKRKR